MRLRPHSLFAMVVAVAAIAGCQSPFGPESLARHVLSADGLRDVFLTSTLSRSGGPFWRRWTYTGVHHRNGTMTGRVTWSGGEEIATGVWEISADGLYCRRWDNDWDAGKRGCFQVSRQGGTLVFDHVSGSGGDSNRYIYVLMPGNPSDR